MLRPLRYARENPIATRLLGLIILSSSAITLIAILMQLYASFHDDLSALNQRLDQVKVGTLDNVTSSLWSFDEEGLARQIETLLDMENVVQVEVEWRDWRDRARRRLISRNATPEQIAASPNKFVSHEYPLVYSDENTAPQSMGILTITASLEEIYNNLWNRTLFTLAIQGTTVLLTALFIIWLVHTLLTQHMETIANFARRLNLDNLSTPLRLKRVKADDNFDELDNVASAINHMRETLLEDIEQRHAIELALISEKEEKLETRRQKLAAEDASRAKSQFLATMSHEIRTPMNGVIGMLEMLRDTPLNETQKHYLDVIHRSGESLLDIINDILDYSKIEAGKMQLELATFDLEDLLEDCLELFGATACKCDIELMGGVKPEVPLKLKGDPTRLRQVLINLLGNAFKFTTSGHIALEVRLAGNASAQQPVLHFSIEDTGIGIDANTQARLFDSFNQADSSTNRQYGGTGLGLAISKSLVELMGGEIGVRSIKGQGANFWFTAQLQSAETESVTDNSEAQLVRLLAGRKLLLTHANAKLGAFLAPYCLSWDMTLDQISTGTATLEYLQETQSTSKLPDFLAIGSHLPDMDAVQLCEQLLKEPAAKAIPRFILNGGELQLEPDRQRELEIQGLLRKPIFVRQLRLHLGALLGHAASISEPKKPLAVDLKLFAHLRVLVAEDNAVNRMVIKGLLGKLNIDAELAENGMSAYEAVRRAKWPYDVILMDCEMAEMDGFEATRSIREYERSHSLKAIPIVALTAHALEEHREAVFASGMNDYLGKPISLNRLYATFERLGLVKPHPK